MSVLQFEFTWIAKIWNDICHFYEFHFPIKSNTQCNFSRAKGKLSIATHQLATIDKLILLLVIEWICILRWIAINSLAHFTCYTAFASTIPYSPYNEFIDKRNEIERNSRCSTWFHMVENSICTVDSFRCEWIDEICQSVTCSQMEISPVKCCQSNNICSDKKSRRYPK